MENVGEEKLPLTLYFLWLIDIPDLLLRSTVVS